MFKILREEYASLFGDLASYSSCYGVLKRVPLSPYTHAAVLITLLSWRVWHAHSWYATPVSVLPSLLGFTLAAYALLLGFGNDGFLKFLATTNTRPVVNDDFASASVLTGISAIFLHFVVVEVIALVFAVVGSAIWFSTAGGSEACPLGTLEIIYAGITWFVFYLALLLALAAALDIYHATRWFVDYNRALSGDVDRK